MVALALFAVVLPSWAQAQDRLKGVRTIAIASLGNEDSAHTLRARVIERLDKSGRLHVVKDPATADAILRGTAKIWATGSVQMDARSHSSHLTNYQGYVSVELVDRQNQSLWSYLVTPSRFRSGSITSDLADRTVSRLLEAIESGGARGSASPVPALSHTHVSLHAAGATLPAPLYLKWFESSGIPVAYDAVGSEAGIQELAAGKIDFAASDMPIMEPDAIAPLKVTHVPTVIGGVVPIYNLPGAGGELYLTPEVLAGIYSGAIRRWNDPSIAAVNHGAHLPNHDIVVIHRSDGSGTTFVWTSFLSMASSGWKSAVGSGTHVAWPIGTSAAGSDGVTELVKKTADSIGYVELIYAVQHELNYAAVRNPAGRFIKADLASITAAAEDAAQSSDQELRFSILNSANKSAYPISTFTWLLVPKSGLTAEKRTAIADLLNWALTAGQKECSSLGYVPLPRGVAERALRVVEALQ